jgi:hypothetical protein
MAGEHGSRGNVAIIAPAWSGKTTLAAHLVNALPAGTSVYVFTSPAGASQWANVDPERLITAWSPDDLRRPLGDTQPCAVVFDEATRYTQDPSARLLGDYERAGITVIVAVGHQQDMPDAIRETVRYVFASRRAIAGSASGAVIALQARVSAPPRLTDHMLRGSAVRDLAAQYLHGDNVELVRMAATLGEHEFAKIDVVAGTVEAFKVQK